MPWQSCDRAHSFVGTEPDSDFSGGGNLDQSGGHHSLGTSKGLPSPWPKKIRAGVKDESPDELSLKLGLLVDPRTVGKYLKQAGRPRPAPGQRWVTFVHNHASEIVACDFFRSVTATFQVLYVFVAIEISSRRILHCNVTDHPTAEWTLQQFREFVDGQTGHRYVIHDRDTVFSAEVDEALNGFDLQVLRTPVSKSDGECLLRACHRYDSPRMFGLHDPNQWPPPQTNSS